MCCLLKRVKQNKQWLSHVISTLGWPKKFSQVSNYNMSAHGIPQHSDLASDEKDANTVDTSNADYTAILLKVPAPQRNASIWGSVQDTQTTIATTDAETDTAEVTGGARPGSPASTKGTERSSEDGQTDTYHTPPTHSEYIHIESNVHQTTSAGGTTRLTFETPNPRSPVPWTDDMTARALLGLLNILGGPPWKEIESSQEHEVNVDELIANMVGAANGFARKLGVEGPQPLAHNDPAQSPEAEAVGGDAIVLHRDGADAGEYDANVSKGEPKDSGFYGVAD